MQTKNVKHVKCQQILLPSLLFWHLQMSMDELHKLHPHFG
jgi:hypothetical protein